MQCCLQSECATPVFRPRLLWLKWGEYLTIKVGDPRKVGIFFFRKTAIINVQVLLRRWYCKEKTKNISSAKAASFLTYFTKQHHATLTTVPKRPAFAPKALLAAKSVESNALSPWITCWTKCFTIKNLPSCNPITRDKRLPDDRCWSHQAFPNPLQDRK